MQKTLFSVAIILLLCLSMCMYACGNNGEEGGKKGSDKASADTALSENSVMEESEGLDDSKDSENFWENNEDYTFPEVTIED